MWTSWRLRLRLMVHEGTQRRNKGSHLEYIGWRGGSPPPGGQASPPGFIHRCPITTTEAHPNGPVSNRRPTVWTKSSLVDLMSSGISTCPHEDTLKTPSVSSCRKHFTTFGYLINQLIADYQQGQIINRVSKGSVAGTWTPSFWTGPRSTVDADQWCPPSNILLSRTLHQCRCFTQNTLSM